MALLVYSQNPGKRVSNCKQVRGSMNSPTGVRLDAGSYAARHQPWFDELTNRGGYRAESFSFTSFEAIFGLALPLDSFIT